MKKVKKFIIGSSFVVLFAGPAIALGASQNSAFGYGEPIKVSQQVHHPQFEKRMKEKSSFLYGKALKEKDHYQKKMYHKKKAAKISQ